MGKIADVLAAIDKDSVLNNVTYAVQMDENPVRSWQRTQRQRALL